MKALRFYRSRLFWLGVPGLVFLLWVWWDSGGHSSWVIWDRKDWMRDLRVEQGRVRWGSREHSPFLDEVIDPGVRAGRSSALGILPCQFDFPAPIKWTYGVMELGRGKARIASGWVALWVIVLGYVAVWLGVVAWWQWRKKRAARRLTEIEMEKEVAG